MPIVVSNLCCLNYKSAIPIPFNLPLSLIPPTSSATLLQSSIWSSPVWLTKCTMSQSAVVLCLDSPVIVCHHYSEPSIIFNKGIRFSQIYSTVSTTYIYKFVFLLLQAIFSIIKSHFKTEASFHPTVKLFMWQTCISKTILNLPITFLQRHWSATLHGISFYIDWSSLYQPWNQIGGLKFIPHLPYSNATDFTRCLTKYITEIRHICNFIYCS